MIVLEWSNSPLLRVLRKNNSGSRPGMTAHTDEALKVHRKKGALGLALNAFMVHVLNNCLPRPSQNIIFHFVSLQQSSKKSASSFLSPEQSSPQRWYYLAAPFQLNSKVLDIHRTRAALESGCSKYIILRCAATLKKTFTVEALVSAVMLWQLPLSHCSGKLLRVDQIGKTVPSVWSEQQKSIYALNVRLVQKHWVCTLKPVFELITVHSAMLWSLFVLFHQFSQPSESVKQKWMAQQTWVSQPCWPAMRMASLSLRSHGHGKAQ